MTSRTGQQIITIHTLLNISRSKGNQTMKFGQLVEFKMKNIFLEKLEPTFYTQSFSATEASILKLRCCPFALTLYRSFYKSKKRSVTSLPASFFPLFFKKNISTLYFIN